MTWGAVPGGKARSLVSSSNATTPSAHMSASADARALGGLLGPMLASTSGAVYASDDTLLGSGAIVPAQYHLPVHALERRDLPKGDECQHTSFYPQI